MDRCLLPNPRVVSLQVRRAPVKYQRLFSTLFMQVGQFVDHDLIHAQTVDGEIFFKIFLFFFLFIYFFFKGSFVFFFFFLGNFMLFFLN